MRGPATRNSRREPKVADAHARLRRILQPEAYLQPQEYIPLWRWGDLVRRDLETRRLRDEEKKRLGEMKISWKSLFLQQITHMPKIKTHQELRVYQLSFEVGMIIFELSKSFPKSENYSLTDQIRRSSRSVSGNIAESFRKRMYPKSFVHKISDCEGEAAETQVWLDYARACGYINHDEHDELYKKVDRIISMLVTMRLKPQDWAL